MPKKSKKVKKVKKVKIAKKSKKVLKVTKNTKVTKAKRGRPKGSSNKGNNKDNSKSNKGNKGRVKKVYEEDDYVLPKSYKMLGYCSGRLCDCMISALDLESKFIFVCPSCGKRARTSKLKGSKKNEVPKPTSKKEYLSPRAAHNDMPAMNSKEVNLTPEKY